MPPDTGLPGASVESIMPGSNEMRLNGATMMKAVETYLNDYVLADDVYIRVTAIIYMNNEFKIDFRTDTIKLLDRIGT